MEEFEFSEELMREVRALQDSIQECCPEIRSINAWDTVLDLESDEMNRLIEHRIHLISEASKKALAQ